MKPATLISASTLALALAGAALAQGQPKARPGDVFALSPKDRHIATDANKDGKVTKDEFVKVINPDAQPYIDAIFDNRDTDKNGWLTEGEMNANGAGRGLGGGRGGAAAAAAAASRGGAAPKAE